MQNIITKEFVEKFEALNGKKADVCIDHILYGSQKMRGCVPCTLWDGVHIGFIIEDERKYLMMDELIEACADDHGCYLKGDVMEIKLKIK